MAPTLMRSVLGRVATMPRRSISSFNKTPPPANQGPHTGGQQAMPLGAYYEAIITKPQPIPAKKPEEPPTTSNKSPTTSEKSTTAPAREPGEATVDTTPASAPSVSAEPAAAQEKARIVFGASLAGPVERAERLQAIKDRSTLVAGVLVPPQPEEPDNCCMSGCVNCVWDRYREDMEEHVAATKRAEARLRTRAAPLAGELHEAISMDDDGGGSETNWPVESIDQQTTSKESWDQLYKNVPVGVREFMRTEKKLKEKIT